MTEFLLSVNSLLHLWGQRRTRPGLYQGAWTLGEGEQQESIQVPHTGGSDWDGWEMFVGGSQEWTGWMWSPEDRGAELQDPDCC